MLVLSRESGQRIRIGDDVIVTVLAIVQGRAKLGIEAPRHVPVNREEVWHDKQLHGVRT